MNKNKPFNLIFETEWNDAPCIDYPITPDIWISECMRLFCGTQVDTIFYNLCSSDSYCCGLENGQILVDNFEKLGDAWVWRYRENTKKLIEAGANPPDLAVKYGHKLGLKVIPVIRMNDPHDQFYKYEVSEFKQKNPQLLIGYGSYIDWEKGSNGHPNQDTIECRTWGMFDYKHEEVRKHKFAIIEEFITRWDNDGISLDFERDPMYFKDEGNPDNIVIMTNFIRDIRNMMNALSKKRNRPLYLHVKIGPDIGENSNRGLDVKKWIEEGLIDAITPGAGYMTISLDLKPWNDLVIEKDCWIYPSINHWRTPEETRAWAKWMYRQGAHGLHLFNYGHLLHGVDKNSHPSSQKMGTVCYDELNPIYYEILEHIGDKNSLCCKNVSYVLENAGTRNQEIKYRAIEPIELPVELAVGKHSIKLPFAENLGDAAAKGFQNPQITLKLLIVNYTYPDRFEVYINDKLLDNKKRKDRAVFIMNNDTVFEYPIEKSFLNIGLNLFNFEVHSLNPQMEVTPCLKNMQIDVVY